MPCWHKHDLKQAYARAHLAIEEDAAGDDAHRLDVPDNIVRQRARGPDDKERREGYEQAQCRREEHN